MMMMMMMMLQNLALSSHKYVDIVDVKVRRRISIRKHVGTSTFGLSLDSLLHLDYLRWQCSRSIDYIRYYPSSIGQFHFSFHQSNRVSSVFICCSHSLGRRYEKHYCIATE